MVGPLHEMYKYVLRYGGPDTLDATIYDFEWGKICERCIPGALKRYGRISRILHGVEGNGRKLKTVERALKSTRLSADEIKETIGLLRREEPVIYA